MEHKLFHDIPLDKQFDEYKQLIDTLRNYTPFAFKGETDYTKPENNLVYGEHPSNKII